MTPTRRDILMRHLIVVLLLAWVVSASAEGTGLLPNGAEPEFVRWLVIQGGLLVALIIVLWSYRKDLVGTLGRDRDHGVILTDLVRSSTEANTRSAAAAEATEKALHRLSRAIERLEPRNGD